MATREPADDIQALKNDLAALRKDIGALAKTVGDQASTTSDDAMDGLKERIAALRSELEGAAKSARARGAEGVAAVEHHIEQKPLQSMLIALGAGLLIGKLLDRR
ncbi:DUF883 family protein [Oceanibaculum nanhaiense]|jgi:ElaB/YqjD/DUF883 family membrane-anchored ribosome-binding protein|uniref:DUF883 family protein n=1 Tax=Oceanibaculum nanhaiense TaxID=1909734 RepID=UPI000A364B40|nr:DUF883 family protein [Oceanibaculum nanhaiense]MBC7135137.1 DUF883 family protein [Oceanibaculum nanhaiense]MDM7946971.1 DUF883 family protein [Oceanibaculum nanhaiense]|tara:strand:- start:53 stop:367 length:315 start_codon:yes stop_codon:yes gene_type:complete